MSNPFDDQGGAFVVLVNHHGQHSLWPAATEVPAGWSIVYEQNVRQECIEYINRNWTDMRPRTSAAPTSIGAKQVIDLPLTTPTIG